MDHRLSRLHLVVLLLVLLCPWRAQAQTEFFNANVVIAGHQNTCTTGPSGGTDAYACTLDRTADTFAYGLGACYQFTADVANTGTASLNLHSAGAKTLTKGAGGVATILADNDIWVGQIVKACYDGTNMQCQNCGGNAPASGGGNVSTNTGTSVDSEVALFAGTDGKTLKRATTTGLLKGTSGVLSAAVAHTDYVPPVVWDKGGAVYNVKAYGATGDGVTNDTTAIQAAFTAAGVGSTVYFPPGTYLLARTTLSNKVNMTVRGAGRSSIIKRIPGDTGNTGELLYFITNNSGITVRDLAFDLNNCLSFCGGIRMINVPRFQILHNRIFDSNLNLTNTNDKFGILVTAAGDGVSLDGLIHGNILDDTQMEVDNVSGVIISENQINRPRSTAGIGLFSQSGGDGKTSQHIKILNNRITDAAPLAAAAITVHLDPPTTDNYTYRNIEIRGNTIYYGAVTASTKETGVRLGTSGLTTNTTGNVFDHLVVSDNLIWFSDAYVGQPWGIELLASPTANFRFANITITGNIIRLSADAGGQGMDLRLIDHLVVHDNVLYNLQSTRNGIGIVASNNGTVQDNVIYGVADADPITMDNDSVFGEHFLLQGNTAVGPTTLYTITEGVPATLRRVYDVQRDVTWNLAGCSALANGGKVTLTAGNVLECADDASLIGSGVTTGTTGAVPYYAADGATVSPAPVTWTAGTSLFTVPGTAQGTTALLAGTPDASGVRLSFASGPALLVRRGDNVSGANMQAERLLATATGNAGTPAVAFTGDNNTGLYNIGAEQLGVTTNGVLRMTVSTVGATVTPPATQTIAGGSTITADACGGLKRLTATGAVTTSTTSTFTAPGTAPSGCLMTVCNVGANTITLDTNAEFKSLGAADIALGPDDCTQVGNDGTVWRSTGPLVAN